MPTQTSVWGGIFPSQEPSIRDYPRDRSRQSRHRTNDPEDEPPRPSIKLLKTKDYTNVSRLAERDHLTDKNWHEWKDRMLRVFFNCDIAEYTSGFTKRPDRNIDPIGAQNWDKNDVWAQQVIINNVTASQMNHIGSKKSSHAMYSALSDTHDNRAHLTVTHLQQLIYETKAAEGDDIPKHLDTLKSYRDRLNKFPNSEFHVYDTRFKSIISASLPISWQTFVEPYNGNANDPNDPDPKRKLSSDAFIGLLREEYNIRSTRSHNGTINDANSTNMVQNNHSGGGASKSLENRITDHKSKQQPYCDHCKRPGHWTSKCRKFAGNKCFNCGKYGHMAKDCRAKKKGKEKYKEKKKDKQNDKGGDRRTDDQSNIVDEHVTFVANEAIEEEINTFVANEANGEEMYNFECYDVTSTHNDERLIFYDWLADSATSSHVSAQREAFITYTPLTNSTATGVGGKEAKVTGYGTVELLSNCNGHKYILRLEDVLHIPGQKKNLISLGRWDGAGGRYIGGGGKITLVTKDGKQIAKGEKVNKNMYKMSVSTKTTDSPSKNCSATPQTFLGEAPAIDWETWHRRFGHVAYSGLQKLLDYNMVDGFNVDTRTIKPDCVACTEAKQHVEPFPKSTDRSTEAGELTHIDLWGKYAVKSINGNQYYLLFVDDSKRYITVEFLKEKSEAAQETINYLTHLIAQGRQPKAIQIDRGKEFVNEKLKQWCKGKGIEIHLTAPYSPSQNGVAERMNRTLAELGRAMLRGQDLPEFLWEPAILHASYIRNRSYTKPLQTLTPFQGWHKRKPDVSHLREFGAPVWILLQGQKETRKMLPKSKRQIYVGFDDGSKAVKYYNAETRKILTSRNFKHLTLTKRDKTPEPITITPNARPEGESSGGLERVMPRLGITDNDEMDCDDLTRDPIITRNLEPNKTRKRKNEDAFEPRKTRGIRTDYKRLQNPFLVEEDDEINSLASDEIHAVIAGDELGNLREAEESPDWPEWKKAMREEMELLKEKGTWELVDKPPDAKPLANKWTYVKKRNKQGEINRYKARLVVKGCGQRLGHDYIETFSPVVRLDTLRAILSLVPRYKLKVQQMDIKGAYLNGILQETVYMKQPEGCEDGTDRVCRLIKTLYGLKQSGREWNKEFDAKIKTYGYRRLISDPCTYIRWDGNEFAIITVWVDDLMLFATSDKMMEHMKNAIKSEWEATDMGQPSKIIGIEITFEDDAVIISQQKYIESLLKKEGLEDANPVAMPMDPNIQLTANPEDNEPNRSNSYAKLIGELQYIANSTRPDISYAVNRLAAYTANPSLQHWTAAKRLLRYLAGTVTLGIYYKLQDETANESNNLFYGYSDAAYANNEDLKSTSAYVYLGAGGAITWKSKKQSIVALSSTEAEYVALAEAGREACWLRNLYGELGFTQTTPTIIRADNEGSIAMAGGIQFHPRSKHIKLRHHWIRDLVADDTVQINACRDPQQTADVLTKALPKPKFIRHREEMGMQSLEDTR
jgi:hypothetical protein